MKLKEEVQKKARKGENSNFRISHSTNYFNLLLLLFSKSNFYG
jgi:hypothetical protein